MFFNAITGLSVPQKLSLLSAAPIDLKETLLEMIQVEKQRAIKAAKEEERARDSGLLHLDAGPVEAGGGAARQLQVDHPLADGGFVDKFANLCGKRLGRQRHAQVDPLGRARQPFRRTSRRRWIAP